MMRKLIATGASAALAIGGASAQTTHTWDGSEFDFKWHNGLNWTPEGEPGANDTAVIGSGADVVIDTSNAACRILDFGGDQSSLTIHGVTLTLGQDDTPTTSYVRSGGLVTLKQNGSSKAEILVRDWVTLSGIETGGGVIGASQSQNSTVQPVIGRASGGDGIVTANGVKIIGHIHMLCSIRHNSLAGEPTFGVASAGDVMRFGPTASALNPQMEISTSTYANNRSEIACAEPDGRVEFHFVTFDENSSPNWRVRKFGTMIVEAAPGASYFVDVPFNIWVDTGGTLEFKHDFSCTGKLTVNAGGAGAGIIKVHKPKTLEFH